MNFTFILIIIYICLIQDNISIRLDKLVIPAYKLRNESTVLECHYKLNESEHIDSNSYDSYDNRNEPKGETLYSVKWYKDNEEFYRYVPQRNPPQFSYTIDGLRVNHHLSDDVRVTIENLRLKASGIYRCEVSAEAPKFSSAQAEGRMEIVYLPKDGPHISGERDQYQIGDTLNLNCTSGKSHPAALVQWLINDEQVVNHDSLIVYPEVVHTHGLITTILGLQVVLDGRHFQLGAMRVKCTASLSPVLWQGDKESVVQGNPAPLTNREAMLLVRSSSTQILYSFNTLVPIILLNILLIL